MLDIFWFNIFSPNLFFAFKFAKHIKKGFEARGEVKEQQRNENVSQEDEEILDKLKDKNLSEEDLKKLYEEIKNKDKEEK